MLKITFSNAINDLNLAIVNRARAIESSWGTQTIRGDPFGVRLYWCLMAAKGNNFIDFSLGAIRNLHTAYGPSTISSFRRFVRFVVRLDGWGIVIVAVVLTCLKLLITHDELIRLQLSRCFAMRLLSNWRWHADADSDSTANSIRFNFSYRISIPIFDFSIWLDSCICSH